MIVVTGATGQLGHLVIKALLKKVPASSIVAAVRNVEKAKDIAALGVQVRHADYTQPASWDAALKGADKVLLISSSEIGQRAKQHRTVIDAAKKAGVKLLAYTSVLRADTSAARAWLLNIKRPRLISAPPAFRSYCCAMAGTPRTTRQAFPRALAHGAVYGCAGNGRISSATRADYAEADAAVLTADNQAGKVYELAGDTAFTVAELAAEDLAPDPERTSATSTCRKRNTRTYWSRCRIAGIGCRIAVRIPHGCSEGWAVRRWAPTEQTYRQGNYTVGYSGKSSVVITKRRA